MLQEPYGSLCPTALQRLIVTLARRTPLRKFVSRRRLGGLLTRIRAGPIDITFLAARFRLHLSDNPVEGGMLFFPDYNVAEIKFLMSCVPKGGVFVDVGANIGLYSLPIAMHVGDAGRVLAIEPGAVSLERLRYNVIASDAQNVVIVPYAVGEQRGEAYLQVPVRNVGGAKVSMVAGGEKVALLPFMEILCEHNIRRIDGIKIDIEGNEDYVLFPLFQDQNRHLWPRGVVIEHLHRKEWHVDCFEILQRSGYERVGETESNAMFRKKEGF